METSETNEPQTKTKPEQRPKNCSCFLSGKSKILIVSAIILGIIILMLGSFAGGVKIGIHKAKFSCDWGKNYERNFIGERAGRPDFGPGQFMKGMMRDIEGRDFRNAHGLAGAIISITDNNIIVKDRDGKENAAAVTEKTLIKSRRDDLKLSDLKTDDQIIVMGSPDENGVVNAVLIRVFEK